MSILRYILALAALPCAVLGQTQATEQSSVASAGAAAPAEVPEPATTSSRQTVYVLPIHEEINAYTLKIVERGVKEAEAAGASAIALTMNTPGGELGTTEKILRALGEVDIPTYTFVEYNAISAGAMIAVATDYIYMAPGSKIGDAMPIMLAPGGGVQPIPPAVREKVEAYTDALVRVQAERTGRDPALVSCMVRRDLEYKIGEEIICKEGQLLTLTNREAARRFGEDDKPLLSEGTVDRLEDMLAAAGMERPRIIRMEVNWAENLYKPIARFTPLLLSLGFLAIMAAMYNPTISTPALIVAGICFFIFFFGHHVVGLAGYGAVTVFVIGLILIAVEAFVIPGFGVAGIAGLLCMLGGLIAAMVDIQPLPGRTFPAADQLGFLLAPAMKLSVSLALAGLLTLGMTLFIPRSRFLNTNMVLKTSTNREAGYDTAKVSTDLLHQVGVATTDLRPSGSVRIGERLVDVFTEGDWIEKGTPVEVTAARGNRIIVSATSEPGPANT